MYADEKIYLDELELDFRRVGISCDAFAKLCRLNAPNEPVAPDGSFVIQLNYSNATAFLRTLPDGAGQETFIKAWTQHVKQGQRPMPPFPGMAEAKQTPRSLEAGPTGNTAMFGHASPICTSRASVRRGAARCLRLNA